MPQAQLPPIHINGAIVLTPQRARDAGKDAGNRSMRAACRKRWNDTDWNVCAERTARLMVLGGFWPAALYEAHVGRPFPTVQS